MVLMKITFPLQRRVRLAQGLWLLSWLSVLSGGFLFCLGVYLKTELIRRAEIMDYTDIHVVPNILMMVGLASIGTNWFASRVCQDSLDATRFPRWKPFLLGWFAMAVVLCSLLLAAMVLCFALILYFLGNGIRFYRDTDVPGRCFQKETIDRLQMELRCCGNNNYRDWFEVQWISNRYLDFTSKEVKDRVRSNVDGRYLLDGVPFSCCNPASPRPCLHTQLLDRNAHYNFELQTEELNLYNRGCRQALVEYYMGLMNRIGPGVLSVIFMQASVFVSLRYLQTATEGAMALENPEDDSEGYLLEKSIPETIEDCKSQVLTLLKLGPVDPGDAEAPAEDKGAADAATSG
uniref:Retinal outer segment membrane protein 1b n=1 Tax=Myripristis murdjan TaxID=586833 RepID=A0A667ZYV3_9TELE